MYQDIVRIKGTRNGLVIVLDSNGDFEDIKKNLLRKMESAKGFFNGAKFSLAQNHNDIPVSQKNELESICKKFGLVPYTGKHPVRRPELSSIPQVVSQNRVGEGALLVGCSLRSGQRISSSSHIVVLGDVHPGAEIISGGSILIMGYCRGIIHAGAGGDHTAKVIADRLAPTVISIADRRYSPNNTTHLPTERQLAKLVGKEIVFVSYAKPEGYPLAMSN